MNEKTNDGEMTPQQRFTVTACREHPETAEYDPHAGPQDRCATWLDEINGQPWNFMPKNAVEQVATAENPHFRVVELCITLMKEALKWARGEKKSSPPKTPALPDNPMHPVYVTGTVTRFMCRIIKGGMGEITARRYLHKKGKETVAPENTARWGDEADPCEAMENDGVDMVLTDGTTIQVKAYETDASERNTMDADVLLEVVNGGVTKYYL